MSNNNWRTALIYNCLGPYHYARVKALSKLVPDLLVIEVASSSALYGWRPGEIERTWKQETLFFGKKAETLSAEEVQQATWQVLEHYRPNVVVTAGYRDPAVQVAVRWARKHRAKTILMLATWRGDKRRWWLKEKVKAWLVQRWFDAAFVGGWRHYLYALSLGFPPERIWRGVDVVDNKYFAINAAKARVQAEALRQRLGLPERYFICVARHSPEKNLKRLLQAYKLYRKMGGRWGLVLVGDGPQRQELERDRQRLALDSVIFAGWVQYDQLPVYYGLAEALILPSISEPWGLVVNEAMASGLPVLVSRKCGCFPELCWRGVNGLDFDPWNVNEIVEVMISMSSNVDRCKAMGKASKEIIANFTPDHWATVLLQCINQEVF